MEQQVFSPRKACLIYCEIDQKQHKEESKMTRSLRADCHLFCIYAGNSQSTFLTVLPESMIRYFIIQESDIYETSDN